MLKYCWIGQAHQISMVSSKRLLRSAHVHNVVQIFNSTGKYQNRYQGGAPDISHILMFYWFESVLYLDPVSKFQFIEITERSGYFVEFSDNVENTLTFKILKITWSQFYIEVW
jgi:hypothetical protein